MEKSKKFITWPEARQALLKMASVVLANVICDWLGL